MGVAYELCSTLNAVQVWDVHGNWSLVRSVDVLDGPASHPLMRLDMAVSGEFVFVWAVWWWRRSHTTLAEDPFDVSNRVLLGSGLDMCAVPLGGGELVWWPGSYTLDWGARAFLSHACRAQHDHFHGAVQLENAPGHERRSGRSVRAR